MWIKTFHNPKPGPNFNFDWEAWDDDTYDEGGPYGYGRTEEAAIKDLKEQIEENNS